MPVQISAHVAGAQVGDRVSAGIGEDYDVGRVESVIDRAMVWSWSTSWRISSSICDPKTKSLASEAPVLKGLP
jgi:hypothetical protein